MLYDDGNHGSRQPYPQQLPYAPQPQPQPMTPYYSQGPMRQGSYADYYNGLTGGRAPRPRQFFGDVQGLPYNMQRAILLRNGQRVRQGNMAYGAPAAPPPTPMPRPRYASATPSMQQGGGYGYLPRQQPGSQFDINGRPRGAWDYQEPQQQAHYPMVTY